MKLISKNYGIALVTVLSLLAFMAVLLYGLASLTSVVQSDIGKRNDIILARIYANTAIFDNANGAIAKIRAFEAFQFSAISNQRISQMSNENRILLRDQYFTNNCTNNQLVPAGFNHGLCRAENSDAGGNNNSLPLLRLDLGILKPCDSSSLVTVINGQNALPLIDDRSNRFSFSYVTGDNTVCHQPNYFIELMNTNFSGLTGVNGARLYRVTARAYGRNGNTQATQQAYFYVGCTDSGVCTVSLLNSQLLR